MNKLREINSQFTLNFGKALHVTIIMLICIFIVNLFVNLPSLFFPSLYPFTSPLALFFGGILAVYSVTLFLGITWETIKSHLFNSPKFIVTIACVWLYFFGLSVAEFLVSLFPRDLTPYFEQMYKNSTKFFEKAISNQVSGFLSICILAPIVEEILFRGILLRGLLQNVKIKPIYAILFTSLIFGVAHVNPWQLLGAGTLGIVFGFVYYRTKSLWLCIFLHVLNNATSFYMVVKNQTMEQSVTNPTNYLWIGLSFILAILVGWFIYKQTPNIKWN